MRQDLYHYRQHIQERSRGLAKCLSTNRFKEKRAHKNRENIKENEDWEVRSLHYICSVGNCITTAEKAKPGCSAGSVASGHTVRGSGMSEACLFMGLPVVRISSHKADMYVNTYHNSVRLTHRHNRHRCHTPTPFECKTCCCIRTLHQRHNLEIKPECTC